MYIYMSYIYTFVCICICLHDTMRECGIPTVTHCLCMYRSTMLVLITCSTHVHIYHIHIYIHIGLLYISDHSHTQVCIEGGSCTDGSETQPYYRMDVWQYLHWWTLLWLYALSHCKKNHVSHCCNCMTICRLRSFIEALIQLTTHSDITQSHIS